MAPQAVPGELRAPVQPERAFRARRAFSVTHLLSQPFVSMAVMNLPWKWFSCFQRPFSPCLERTMSMASYILSSLASSFPRLQFPEDAQYLHQVGVPHQREAELQPVLPGYLLQFRGPIEDALG